MVAHFFRSLIRSGASLKLYLAEGKLPLPQYAKDFRDRVAVYRFLVNSALATTHSGTGSETISSKMAQATLSPNALAYSEGVCALAGIVATLSVRATAMAIRFMMDPSGECRCGCAGSGAVVPTSQSSFMRPNVIAAFAITMPSAT